MWSQISILVTDTGFFEYLFLNSEHSRLLSLKLPKIQEKHTAERFFWQPICEDTETHTVAYTAFF